MVLKSFLTAVFHLERVAGDLSLIPSIPEVSVLLTNYLETRETTRTLSFSSDTQFLIYLQ